MNSIFKFEELWQQKYNELESEIELHRISFAVGKICSCRSSECRHYEREKKKLFAGRINQLLSQGILINAASDLQAMCLESDS